MKELTSGNIVKLEEGDKLQGKYVSCDESAMYNDSYAFKVTTDDGETKVTFVNNIVKDLIESNNIKKGQEIAVLFKGLKDNKTGTAKYKDYTVLIE